MRAIFVLFFFFFPLFIYSQEKLKDPFRSLLPGREEEEIEEEKEVKDEEVKEVAIFPPAVVIEGVLWGSDKPSAIINGEVYSIGDSLKGLENSKIYKIEGNNEVYIFYQGKLFKMGIKKGRTR